jgi:hypothetical protein
VDWILQHLQLILVIAGSIAMWLNNRQREKQGLPADFDEDGVPENNRSPVRAEVRELAPLSRDGSDPEQEDRVRRIQEEIRRKIAERRGQGPASAQPPTLPPRTIGERMADPFRPIFQETPPSLLKPAARPEPAPVPVEVAGYADEAALERQRALSEQLRQLEERRRESLQTASTASRGASAVAGLESSRGASPVAPRVGAGSLPDEFRDPRALRTAMVWREVLGAPVGLR